jgi:DNA polymerase-4/DNA polymerase IV (DinB-like DNA polymerase)
MRGDNTGQIIIHVDMDAFFASVEMRDNPSLVGKPVIIGSLPQERGVVSTCSYEARKYGVHSAMNIKEAYRRCPNGVYIRPNFEKYKAISEQIHRIWDTYTPISEKIALDEAYLDVTESAGTFERATEIAHTIKERTLNEIGLSCSVGVAYSMAAAKIASEERKPDGYFEIPTPQDFVELVLDRDVRILPSVGKKTTERLHAIGFYTVRDILERQDELIEAFGNHGRDIIQLANGIDDRKVTPYRPEDAKSISREITFQEDVFDYTLLSDVVFVLALSVEERARRYGLHGSGVVLKITYSDMKSITRSRVTPSCDNTIAIHREASDMLLELKRRPVRLIGVGVYNLTGKGIRQMTLDEVFENQTGERERMLAEMLDILRERYHYDFSGNLEQIYRGDSLHSLVEFMRVHRS